MRKYSKISGLILTDIVLINAAFIMALMLRFDFEVGSEGFINYFAVYAKWALLITLLKIITNAIVGLYSSLWQYAGVDEIFRVGVTAAFGSIAALIMMMYFQQILPRSVYFMTFVMDIIFLGGSRIGYRMARNIRYGSGIGYQLIQRIKGKGSYSKPERVLIVGAGNAGASMIKEIDANPASKKKVVGVIDDDKAKLRTRIAGKKVLGNRNDIAEIVKKYYIDEIIIAIPSASRKVVQSIANICGQTGCKTSILPALIDLIDGKVKVSKLRKVSIVDLLGRDPVSLDTEAISSYLEDKIVLVTGAGGSIGSELCRQIAIRRPRRLIALDIYENNLYELGIELGMMYPDLRLESVICSVRNKEMLERVFLKYQPHVVFHAAAHKHVPLMESNPAEALLNNILGTKNILDLSHEYTVEKFILISTDKAVNPTNVMGASKRVAEMLLQHKSQNSHTNFSAVRFGNVLGSNGSVIPLFQKQIEQGGPVTVTHKEVTRYFMTIPEAVQLVIQTGAMASGGEIFILDMGESVKIIDLAENLIRLSGLVPYTDVDIVFTGLRPGEKLYEELLLDEEGLKSTSHGGIFIGKPVSMSPALEGIVGQGEMALAHEITGVCKGSPEEIKEWLHKMVPNYTNGKDNRDH